MAPLRWIERATTRWPLAVVLVLITVTLGLGSRAATLEMEVDMTQFGDEDSVAVQAMERVQEEFSDPSASVQVILDAGPEGNILDESGLEAIAAAEQLGVEVLGPDVRIGPDGQPQVISVRSGPDPGLLSDDADLADNTARGTVILIPLDTGLSESERTEAAERVDSAFADQRVEALADTQVTVYSLGLFGTGLLDAIQAEAPQLFGLALLVVLMILTFMYRSLFDVAVGLAGLVATVVCTMGFIALLGPGYLGLTGPPSQLLVIVPVLLVGLGIDYSMHLTARYREQRAAGQAVENAAGGALRTVGIALAIATAATATGFAATATAPLGMLADLGVFVAVGVVSAFIILTLLVPSARVLRDRRRAGRADGAVRELTLGRIMNGPIALARRVPAAGLMVAGVLVVGSLVAATALETEFDRDDFIPEGSDIAETLDHQSELFGAGVTESTYVVIDGDFTDPAVVEAIRQAEQRLGDVEGVRMLQGRPQVRSVVTLASAADANLGPDADLAATYDQLRDAVGDEQMDQVLRPDARAGLVQIRTIAGDSGAEQLDLDVQAAFEPVEGAGATVVVTSEPVIIGEMSQDLSSFQAQSIGLTLVVVLALLTVYYLVAHRRWILGPIAMIPAVVSASLIVGVMWLLGFSFNVLTATLTAIAVGIGVPYGVHMVNRFIEALRDSSASVAIGTTLRNTGGALAGSALTTLGAFVVLSFSGMPPMRSLGLLGGTGIAVALIASLLVTPGALVLWARRVERGDVEPAPADVR